MYKKELMDSDKSNPFLSDRKNMPISTTSILNYGDFSLSLFSHLKKTSSISSRSDLQN